MSRSEIRAVQYVATHYRGISIWGHTSTSENVAGLMSRFGAAVRSLRSAEDAIPALSAVPHGARR
jgi:hypothetical protein